MSFKFSCLNYIFHTSVVAYIVLFLNTISLYEYHFRLLCFDCIAFLCVFTLYTAVLKKFVQQNPT